MSRRTRHTKRRIIAMFMIEAGSRHELKEMVDAVWVVHLKHCRECTDHSSHHVRIEAEVR